MIYDFQTKAKLAKPCPLCGSKRIMADSPEYFAESHHTTVGIECADCGLMFRDGAGTTYNECYREVLKKWNRRAAL